MNRRPYRRPPLVIRDHAPDIARRALLSAANRSGVYAPLIGPMIEQGLIQPGRDDGAPVPTRKGTELIGGRR